MQRILFYNHTGQVSGAEKVLLAILERLDRQIYRPVLLCPASGTLAQSAKQLGVECLIAPELNARFTWRPDLLLTYLWSFFLAIAGQRRIVRQAEPDLLHANSIRAGLVATAATTGLGLPVIWHIHDLLPRHPFSTAIRLFVVLSKRVKILAVSEAAANRFKGWILHFFRRRQPQAVIRNAVNTDVFRPLPEVRGKVRESLDLNNDDFVFGSIGQITSRKGQLELLQAFATIRQEIPEARLVIAGAPLFNQDQLYLENIRQATVALGLDESVRFLGPRKDVAQLMAAFDVFVLNSESEAFSLVVLEALACGTPVIATAVGGTPEVVIHETTGWLIPVGDKEALTQALRVAFANPELRKQFSLRTPALMCSELTPAAYMKSLTQFYSKCAQTERNSSRPVTVLTPDRTDGL